MDLPAGIVTFLFTDIEGSTKLWEDHTDVMARAQARPVGIIGGCVERHSGFLIQSCGEGDSTSSVSAGATMSLEQALVTVKGIQ